MSESQYAIVTYSSNESCHARVPNTKNESTLKIATIAENESDV